MPMWICLIWPVWRDMPESSFKSQSSATIEIGEMLLANEI